MAPGPVIERSFGADGPATLRIGVPEGLIEVVASDRTTVDVEITALRGGSAALERVAVDAVERSGGLEVAVTAQLERFGFHVGRRGVVLRVHVACPAGSSLEVSSAAADVRTEGHLGTARVKTASGDVAADRVATLAVQSVSGDVFAREVAGDAVVKTTSGDVGIRTVQRGLVVTAVSGDVKVDRLGGELEVSTVSGDVRVGIVGGSSTVNAVSGDVELGVPPGHRLWLDVRSATGSVRSDLGVEDAPHDGDEPVWEIVVRTVSGDVRLCRAT